MSRGEKLKKFSELANLPGVLEKPKNQAGQWANTFGNHQPITLELGCGYGEYTIALAQRYPQNNYIGVDIQGARLWHGAKTAATLGLTNVRWLRIEIEHLLEYFAPLEIAEIWLTFPDPFPRLGKAKKRLTAPRFLAMYKTIIQPGGRLQLKTDVAYFIAYSRKMLKASDAVIDRDIINVSANEPRYNLDIITRFERRHRLHGRPIYYLSWHW